jgi:hypothetical protein
MLPTATWQYQYARALQTWADVTPLNFRFVSDNGAPAGSSGPAQGSTNFGDTRFYGYNSPHGYAAYSYYPSGSTLGGDSNLGTNVTWYVGTYPDLYSILLHETGLTIGMGETTNSATVMYPTIMSVYTGLTADDIAGAQAIYGARHPDAYDAHASNDTIATATALTLNTSGAFSIQADLSSMTDVDYYKIVAPTGTNGSLTVTLDAKDYSLLIPTLSVYNAAGTLIGHAAATTYGGVLTVTLTGLSAGQTYTIGVNRADTSVFGMGAYGLSAQFGGMPSGGGGGGGGGGTGGSGLSPDLYDPNGTMATAKNFGTLTSYSLSGLTLDTPTNVDYYSFSPGANAKYAFSSTFTQSGGTGGTMTTAVMNSQGTILGSAQSATGSESFTLALYTGQTYYIKVYSPTGSLFTYGVSWNKTGKIRGGGAVLVSADSSDDSVHSKTSQQGSAGIPSSTTQSIAAAEIASFTLSSASQDDSQLDAQPAGMAFTQSTSLNDDMEWALRQNADLAATVARPLSHSAQASSSPPSIDQSAVLDRFWQDFDDGAATTDGLEI